MTAVPYEDLQRNIRNWEARPHAVLSRSMPEMPTSGVADALRVSDIARVGGFRRHFLHGAGGSPEVLRRDIDNSVACLVHFLSDQRSVYDELDGGGLFEESTTMELVRASLSCQLHAGDQQHEKKLSLFKACVATFKGFICTGILFLPQAMSNSGWAGAAVCMGVSAIVSTLGMLILAELHVACPLSYPELGREACGSGGYALISTQIALSQFLFGTTGIIFIDKTVRHVFASNGLPSPSSSVVVSLTCVAYIPLAFIRRIGKMRHSSMLGSCIILFTVAYVACACGVHVLESGVAPSAVAFRPGTQWLVFAGTSVYIFEGISLVIPIRESMKAPEHFPLMMSGMMVVMACLLTGFGVVGYLAFGEEVQTVVLNELPGSGGTFFRLLYIPSVVCSYPLIIYPTFSICEGFVFAGVAPSRLRQLLKNASRTATTIAAGLLAYLLADQLSIFVSIVGSICCVPLAMLIPGVLHYRLLGTRPRVCALLVLFGAILMPLTLAIDICSAVS